MQTIAHTWTRARALVCVVFWLVAANAAYAVNCTQYLVVVNGNPLSGTYWRNSPQEACVAAAQWFVSVNNAGYSTSGASGTSSSCTFSYSGQNGADTGVKNYGMTERTGDYCVPDACAGEAGQTFDKMNFTVAWGKSLWPVEDPGANSANQVGDWTTPVMGSTACVPSGSGFCGRTLQQITQVYTSLQPSANGLYRLSADVTGTGTGQTCTPGPADAAANPATADKPCPGTKGEVNGKTVCLASSGTGPSNPASAPNTGSGGAPTTTGNPTAGDAPTSGPGSGSGGAGRTPVSGNGGNAGGGSSAYGGAGAQPGTPGSGTPGDPYRPKDPCGLPGTPACKLDETGTPNGSGAFNGATSDLNGNKQSAIDQVTGAAGAAGKDTSWGFGFSLPTGCTALTMYEGVSINMCQWQGTIHDLMSMVWVLATIAGVVWMVYGTLTKGS